MVFAVEEINNKSSLLPGVKLGYRILDSCDNIHSSLQALFSLVSFPGSMANDKQMLETKNANLMDEKDYVTEGLMPDEEAQILTTQDEASRCLSSSPIPAVIGLASSSPTGAVAQVLGSFNIPLVRKAKRGHLVRRLFEMFLSVLLLKEFYLILGELFCHVHLS